MPRPVSASATYMPGLDGLRALAVAAVIGYHLDLPYFSGGLLGVGMFFTLSGFLITFILLRTWDRRGDLDLGTFWLRRARRLLPAVAVLLLVVLVATALVSPDDLPRRLAETVAATFYVSNWYVIFAGDSYFAAFNAPGALDHLWSLAVEEQFYLVWPLLLLALLRAWRGRLDRIALTVLGLAALSFVWMAVLAEPGFDNTRAYEGTDTRAGGLLVGAALAMVWRPDRLRAAIAPRARAIIDSAGLLSLLVLVWLVAFTDPFALGLYRGGILALSVATAVLVAVVVHPASRVAWFMGTAPLVWVGERSYGIYLWHVPVIAFTPAALLADAPFLRGTLQVALSVGLAALSWTVMEDPIRKHGLLGAVREWRARRESAAAAPVPAAGPTLGPTPGPTPAHAGPTAGRPARASLAAIAGGTGAVTVLGILVLVLLPVLGGPDQQVAVAAEPDEATTPTPVETATPTATPSDDAGTSTPSPTPSPTPAGDPETSCQAVVHLGDSTSRGLFNADFLPDENDRLDARYRQVGVEDVTDEVFPAMSVVETYEDEPNADDRVGRLVGEGYDGCWVIALGLQDAANQSVGGVVDLPDRIDRLMAQIDDGPALFMTGAALEQDGPWSDPELQKWNAAVVEACERWPSMRVWDQRSEMQDDWYDKDGIHFNSAGDRARAQRMAVALATAFPADGDPPEDCLVTTDPDQLATLG